MGKKSKKNELSSEEYQELQNDIQSYSKNKNTEISPAPSAIIGLLGEFFDDFIVIGHDLKGYDFILRKVDNPKDLRALNSLMKDYVEGKIGMTPGIPSNQLGNKNMNDIIQEYEDMMEEDFDEDDDDDEEGWK